MLEQASWVIVSLSGFILVWLVGVDHERARTAANWIGILVFSFPWFWLPLTGQPKIVGTLGTVLEGAGLPFLVLGVVLCVRATRKIMTAVGPAGHGEPSRLVTDGAYGFVRHPIYSGLFMVMLGWSLIWGGVYSILLIPILYFLFRLQALLEERLQVERKFGEEYVAYRKKVPAFFPNVVSVPLSIIALLIVSGTLLGWIPLV